MQGNSLIKTFAILFGLVSIYQLSFTFISSTLENKAKNAAIEKISENEILFSEKRAREEVRFLDSIGDFPVLMYSSYNDAKQKELTDAEPMVELRKQRNNLLAETDFYALSDVTMSSDMQTYRQNLRDLPSGKDTVEKCDNVTWPTKP